jgi:hypothetical protein
MEMRFVVPEASGAAALAARLATAFGVERVSLQGDRGEVGVQVERESDPAVIKVVDAVERWLDQSSLGTAQMWLGGQSYRVSRWVPVQDWQ